MDNGRSQPYIPATKAQIESWQASYDNLFKDKVGRHHFEAYLDGKGSSDGSHKMSERLQFTGAVLGFRTIFEKGNISEAKNFARTIFKRYFVNSRVVLPLLRKETYDRLSEFIASLDSAGNEISSTDKEFVTKLKNAFNDAQKEVHESLANSAYRSFLTSQYFVDLLNADERNNYLPSLNGHIDSLSSNVTHSLRLDHPPPLPPPQHSGNRFSSAIASSSSSSQPRSCFASEEEAFHSHRNFLASNASFAAADEIEANNNRSQSTGAIPKSNKINNRMRLCHPTKPLSSLPEDAEVKINSSNLSQVPSILSSNSLHKLSPPPYEPHDLNRHQQSYFKYCVLPQPPNPYHVDYGPILPTSAQDSELASYSSGATRSDVSSHLEIRPDSKISEEEMKHHKRLMRRDISSNRGANRIGIDLNKSAHITAATQQRQKAPNPEVDPKKFFELIRSKLEALAEMQAMQQSANPINIQSLRVLNSQEEGQAILDSHVKKCLDWGEPTPPTIDCSGCSPPPGKVHPSVTQQRLVPRTLPRSHYPHSQFNQMSSNEKVACWNQDKDSSSKSKKSSHSVHSGSTKSCKSKNCGGERGRAAAVGASLTNLMTEQAATINNRNHFSGKPQSASNYAKTETSVYIYYTLEDPKNGKKSGEDSEPTVYKVTMNSRPVKLFEFKNILPAYAQDNSYKHYFKIFDEAINSYVFEDITDDDAELPILPDGYIMANIVKSTK